MLLNKTADPIEYLVIGHITCDLTPEGPILGGTVSYSALTAHALGLKVGMVTAIGPDVSTAALAELPIAGVKSDRSTTFENIPTPQGRVQKIHHHAPVLQTGMVPTEWTGTAIVHIGPIAHEIGEGIFDLFPDSIIGVTPQGWLRKWDQEGHITPTEWTEAEQTLAKATAVILSIHDVGNDPARIQQLAEICPIVVATDGPNGAHVYSEGKHSHFFPPSMTEIDSVGAGDIFAAAFYCKYYQSKDPFEAGRFATRLAAYSVGRIGLASVPTPAEIKKCQ